MTTTSDSTHEILFSGGLLVDRALEPVDLADELAGVAGADVGLEHEREARSIGCHGIRRPSDHVEHLVPVALDGS